jgi:hypothetical protein
LVKTAFRFGLIGEGLRQQELAPQAMDLGL